MKALITGASSGIGLAMAKYLDSLGYELILVSKSKDKLEKASKNFNKCELIVLDLKDLQKVKELYVLTKSKDIDILINNAGFGLHGYFDEIDMKKEMEMVFVNVEAVHLLTKLFVTEFVKRDSGYILNVASAAGFGPGPLMATYYATKNYVLSLTEAISYELKEKGSNVHVSALCPGPVDTNFNNVAGVSFSIKPLTSDYVAKYAIDNMLNNKVVIIPGIKVKLATFFRRFAPRNLILKITYNMQKNKIK